jgi:hypothetical protein
MNRKIISHSADHIKRQAKTIKKEEGITHVQALDKSAVICGYHNWAHFLNKNKESSSSTPTDYKQSNTMNPYRKLLVAGVNELLDKKQISLDGIDENFSQSGHIITNLFGYSTVIMWADIGFEELRVSVWWKYDHSLNMKANFTGNSREDFILEKPLAKRQQYKKFVGVTASGWLERNDGQYIQGEKNRAIFEIYTRRGEKEELESISDPKPKGFKSEGNFRF